MERLKNFIGLVYRAIQRNKLQFLFSVTLAAVVALILSLTLGESYDSSNVPLRGPARKVKRQTTQSSDGYKDPFPNRPRIQTKNGHLIIEASQDKNIDFKTSGSRGTITINGVKLDQILNISKAIEKTFQQTGNKTSKQSKSSDPYEMILENIYLSDGKILNLERKVDELKFLLKEFSNKLRKSSKEWAKVAQQASKMNKKQETLLVNLKQNDCVNNETGQAVCKNGATCIDTYNGFKCLCPTNFEGPTCEQDVDECAKFRNTDLGCQNGAKCVNLVGGYRCECTPQFHGVHCTEQHEDCSLSSSKSLCGFGKCINLARTVPNQANYECLCDQGWTTDGKSPACVVDINECMVGLSYQSGTNVSVDSSVPWSNSLMAAYPCSQNPYVECVNLPGSFQCGPCPSGYTGNGRVCRDIDECATNNGGCSTSPPVECINTQGSRRCGSCPTGYAGDGITCTPTTACSLLPNGGCHPMARCLDIKNATLNDRLCYCQYPYEGDGVGIDGCKLSPLAANATNISADPFIFPSLKQDDCHPNPCKNGGECLIIDDSYECICPLGKSGKRCEVANIRCGGDFFSSRGEFKFPFPGSFNDVLVRPTKNEMKVVDQHYGCYWRIAVASNMSIQILFNELSNKANPLKKIYMYLANSTDSPLPSCAESLDVRERLDADPLSDSLTSAPNYRLLARFCPDARGLKSIPVSPSDKKSLALTVESNTVDLEYTFSETRTQFGEPSLAFDMNWTSIEPPCGGDLAIAETGSISSPKFPEFYQAGIECRYLIRVPLGHRVRMQFGELNLLTGRPHSSSCYDSLTIIDGSIGSERPILFKYCANNSTLMGKSQTLPPIMSSSSSVEVILISRPDSSTPLMRPKQKRGFYLTYASESTLPGCGGLYTQKSSTIRSIDYEPSPVEPNQRENAMLALQISRYFEPKDGGSVYPPQDPAINSMYDFVIRDESMYSSGTNSTPAVNRRMKWYKTRCEYEIRPANQGRDHKIAIDWLDMPGEPVTQTNALSTWSRRLRCNAARLTIYDGNPLDGSNRTEIARFCSGDRYNSSSPLLMPVTSSGHVLLIVYESRLALDEGPSGSDLPSGSIGSGFKLHYSTVCSGTYEQLSGQIMVDISLDVPDCLYHIMLPPNNSISLLVTSAFDSLTTSDGRCAAQAIFMDGAVQNSRLALIGVERQMKSFKFEKFTETGTASNLSSRAGESFNESISSVVKDEPDPLQIEVASNSYWQYTWSPAHDIKEFEVCKLPFLGFDSIWNHLSLMFRMKPRLLRLNQSGTPQKLKNNSLKLSVRYQAEPSCGGIISEPREGRFVIESTREIKSINSYPLTATKYDTMLNQQFNNPCAWILRARPNQVVNVEFEAPTTEINKRFNEWLSWKKTHNMSALFDCSQVFQESIELYEPSLNRTRHLCLTDLVSNNLTAKWTTQSNIVYLRLRNETDNANGSSKDQVWSSRRPLLSGNLMITANYKFVSLTNRSICGGNLLHDSGVLTSPRFPFNYPPGMNCTWIIKTNPGQQIRLNFTRFDLEKQADCLFDFLELRNGALDGSPLIGRFCNQDLENRTIVAHSGSVWITFRSDSHLSRPGFEVRYDAALTGCGGKLTTPTGQIDSPNYPLPYAHNSSCEWTIELSKSNRVQLYVLDLDLSENSSFCQPDGLKTDYLEIFDVAADNSTKSFGKLCSVKELSQERSFRSTGNKLTITYRSQVFDNSRGFRLHYRTLCNGPIELSGARGVIESPGFPNGYQPHMKCDWLIRGPTGTNLTLNITDLEIEDSVIANEYTSAVVDLRGDSRRKAPKQMCTADFLEIWARTPPFANLEAPQTNSTSNEKGTQLVQSICGTMDRWNLTSLDNLVINLNTSVANVKFVSDRSVETKGFRIEWKSRS